jgi:hypothetical protein
MSNAEKIAKECDRVQANLMQGVPESVCGFYLLATDINAAGFKLTVWFQEGSPDSVAITSDPSTHHHRFDGPNGNGRAIVDILKATCPSPPWQVKVEVTVK